MHNQKTLSIWLLPDSKTINYRSIINHVSKTLGSVSIIPHITLTSSFNNSEEYSVYKLREVFLNQASFTIEAEKIDTGNAYFQSLFLNIKMNPIIKELRKKSLKYFDCREKNDYIPHMSLAYGKFEKSEKNNIINGLAKSLLNHKIHISSVAIAENDEYNLKWKIIKKVNLDD